MLSCQLYLTVCIDPMDCSPPGSSVHGDSPGKNTGVCWHALLQGIFSTQGSNPGLPHCRLILYHLSNQGYDPTNVGNLISASSAFYKSNLNIWKFSVHILLKPGLENFEHYFARVWDECNCDSLSILWHCLSLGLERKLTFSSPWPLLSFPNLLAYWVQPFHNSAGILSPPLALFIVMLPKDHLTLHSRMSRL